VLVPPVLVVVVLRSRFLCDQQNEDDDNYEDDQATPASRPPIVGFFAISRTRTTTTTRTIRQFPRLAPQSSVSSPSAERGRRRPRGRSGNSRVSPPQSSSPLSIPFQFFISSILQSCSCSSSCSLSILMVAGEKETARQARGSRQSIVERSDRRTSRHEAGKRGETRFGRSLTLTEWRSSPCLPLPNRARARPRSRSRSLRVAGEKRRQDDQEPTTSPIGRRLTLPLLQREFAWLTSTR
jgi:hypothetical protein